MKKILVACEESQAVTIEFRKLGFEAYSCDILPCSGGHPEWHITDGAIKILWGNNWDLVVAHPPCDFLANSGVQWLFHPEDTYLPPNERRRHPGHPDRLNDLEQAALFFNQFLLYGKLGGKIAIENPIMHKYAKEMIPAYTKYSQIIQPWQFGHGETKATCLWLYRLPKLEPTNIVDGREQNIWKMSPGPERAKLRSKTYPGIAKAIATQWSKTI